MAGKHYHHGNSPAAWTGVIITIIGFCVGSAFTVMAQPLGVAAGGGIVVLAGIVGLVMRSMGMGHEEVAVPQQAGSSPVSAADEAKEAEEAAEAEGEPATTGKAGAAGAVLPEPQQATVSG
jgi:hypothetical protein